MAWTATLSGTYATAMGQVQTNFALSLVTFRGTAKDAAYGEGYQWVDSSAAAEVHKLYYDADGSGPADYEVGSRQHGDLKFLGTGGGQVFDLRFENVTSDATPAASNVGGVKYRTDTKQLRLVRDSSVLGTVVNVPDGGYISKELPVHAWDLDATNPPTAVTIGTTPTIRGLLFNATNQKMSCAVVVPAGYSAAADCKLRIWGYLNSAETASDTIDVAIQLLSLQADNGELATATSTQYTKSESIGAQNTQYALHKLDVVLTYNDATNPIAAGDLLEIEFALSSVASVAGFIFRTAQLLFPFGSGLTE